MAVRSTRALSLEVNIPENFDFISFYFAHVYDFGRRDDERWIDSLLKDLSFPPSHMLKHKKLNFVLAQVAGFATPKDISSLITSLGGLEPGIEGAAIAYLEVGKKLQLLEEATFLSVLDRGLCPIHLGVPLMPTLSLFKGDFWKLRWSPYDVVFGNDPYFMYYETI